MNTPAETGPFVPLTDLTDLARLVRAMRRAQRDYFAARRQTPHVGHDNLYRAARDLEARVDAAAADALARERQTLPGMGGAA